MTTPDPVAFCPKCDRYVTVADTFTDVAPEPGGQRGYHVTALVCGHDLVRPDGYFEGWAE